MLNARNFLLLAVLVFCTTLYSNQGRANDNDHTKIVKEIYPAHYEKIPISHMNYQALQRGLIGYVGKRFHTHDPECMGGTVPLAKQVDSMFSVPPEAAESIDKDLFFTWSIMLHGGTCQTGLVFSRGMKVKLVATYIVGMLGDAGKIGAPSVLSVYVNNMSDLKYLPVLERWASSENRSFSATPGLFAPKRYQTRIYNLHCKTKGNRIDVPECRIHLTETHLPLPAKNTTQIWPNISEHIDWGAMRTFWKRSMNLPGIDTGPVNSTRYLLVYFDPNCPICAHEWKVLQPYINSVRIH